METKYIIHILNYNHDPGDILRSLVSQVEQSMQNIEIWLWDDGSGSEFRTALLVLKSSLPQDFITWRLENDNIGRARMRQKIIDHSANGWMVSLDSDMEPANDFVFRMISDLTDRNAIYVGEHYYPEQRPGANFLLHWYYGRKRELPALKSDPYDHFSTAIFAWHGFRTGNISFYTLLTGYGHEDTMFGLMLARKKIPVRTAGMRAIHRGLNTHEDFLKKQLDAVHNLSMVRSQFPEYRSGLLKWGKRIGSIPLLRAVLVTDTVRQICLRTLRKDPSKLFYLDILKLNEWLQHQ